MVRLDCVALPDCVVGGLETSDTLREDIVCFGGSVHLTVMADHLVQFVTFTTREALEFPLTQQYLLICFLKLSDRSVDLGHRCLEQLKVGSNMDQVFI